MVSPMMYRPLAWEKAKKRGVLRQIDTTHVFCHYGFHSGSVATNASLNEKWLGMVGL